LRARWSPPPRYRRSRKAIPRQTRSSSRSSQAGTFCKAARAASGWLPRLRPVRAQSAPAAAPRATRSAAAAARPSAPTQAEAAAPSVNLNVDFPTNSATLTPDAKATLDRLGRALTSKDLASYRFRIEGHTDTVGSPAYNQALSQRRADAVAAYLEQAFSIPSSRLEAVGMGEQGLLVVTPPQTAELRNRRVAVINLGA